MTKIGVIVRGKYGKRLVETVRSKTGMEVTVAEVPQFMPDFIDDPEEFMSGLDMNMEVFNSEIIITYSLHPDITPQIAKMAGEAGVKALIVPGGSAKAPVRELEEISEKFGIFIDVDEICCNLKEDDSNREFTCVFGKPVLEIELEGEKVSKVHVVKGAPCGSTWHLARLLPGTPADEAGPKAGLIISQYPCRAVRGQMGGIHESSELHKAAVEDAIRKFREKE